MQNKTRHTCLDNVITSICCSFVGQILSSFYTDQHNRSFPNQKDYVSGAMRTSDDDDDDAMNMPAHKLQQFRIQTKIMVKTSAVESIKAYVIDSETK